MERALECVERVYGRSQRRHPLGSPDPASVDPPLPSETLETRYRVEVTCEVNQSNRFQSQRQQKRDKPVIDEEKYRLGVWAYQSQ
jgi:hypothetical protein